MRLTVIVILCLSAQLHAQFFNSQRIKVLSNLSDTVKLDTLSIIPSSVLLYDSLDQEISSSTYKLDYNKAQLLLHKSILENYERLVISYKVFPYDFSKPYAHREMSIYEKKEEQLVKDFYYNYQYSQEESINKSELDKNGSIARGISIGNNQNAIVNSSLNLQLSGKLNEEFDILASISDNNIPIQPDGNTQQLQEFDKVFIQLSNQKTTLRVGDIETQNRDGYFLQYNKKVQGAFLSSQQKLKNEKSVSNELSAAVSKAQFARKQFNGIEGVQGPYRLTGANNENYVIIVAGTERVYIDGVLLERGLENDYTINYNTGELFFTPNQLITKDKRIIVEYEYTDKNYARFIVANNNTFEAEKGTYWINVYSESDAKNQPLDQELNDKEKTVLSAVGDDLQNALVRNFDSIAFNDDLVLYRLSDTVTSDGVYYDSVFIYSTNPENAFYRLGFSYVGEANGNYIQDINAANGRVYKWIAPINGIPQGSYEPIVLLVTPKKKQLLNLGGTYMLSQNTKANIELGISNNDINTFSNKDDDDNLGLALRSAIERKINWNTSNLLLQANYEYLHQDFSPAERFRSSEFERDWNVAGNSAKEEHYVQLGADLSGNKIETAGLQSGFFKQGENYKALRNQLHVNWANEAYQLKTQASYLYSEEQSYNTNFIRQKIDLSRKFRKLLIGMGEEQEFNRWKTHNNDSLLANSFQFFQYKLYTKTADSLKRGFFAEYVLRDDYLPLNNNLEKVTHSKDISVGIRDLRSANSQLKMSASYRSLSVLDTTLANNLPEDNLLGRLDYRLKLFKGLVSSTTFYEIGTGLELKKEFSYVEVSPGQGVYYWSDYNDNDIKELNEFDVAAFQDQANYIRVFLPTNQYVKTYSSQVNQTFGIYPYKRWRNEKGIKNIVSKFSDQLAFRLDRKIAEQDFEKIFNVFNTNIADSILLNYTGSIRNTLSFNKISSKFGVDQTVQSNTSKLLLVNGFDTRKTIIYGLRVRWNLFSFLSLNNNYEIGEKAFDSEFFPTKNYELAFKSVEVKLSYQPGVKYRLSFITSYREKQNNLSVENSNMFELGIETNYSIVSKGILTAKLSFLDVKYNGESNSSLAYEMLEGFVAGKNYTWSIIGQYNISKSLQMDVSYAARANSDQKIVHNGTIQLRAFF